MEQESAQDGMEVLRTLLLRTVLIQEEISEALIVQMIYIIQIQLSQFISVIPQ